MRGSPIAISALLVAACGGGREPRGGAVDNTKTLARKDATVMERYLIVDLRWTQVIDRYSEPGPSDEPNIIRHSRVTTADEEERLQLPDYQSRPKSEQPEIRVGEWLLAIPERSPTTFELTLDAGTGDRILVISRGWSYGSPVEGYEVVLPEAIVQSNRRVASVAKSVGLSGGVLGRWYAFSALAHHGASTSYYELIEQRNVEVTDRPPANAERGVMDSLDGQQSKQEAWPLKEISMSPDEDLETGAIAWREGNLIKAQEAYRSALKQRPDDWRAAFQLAWIEAAFGQLPPAKARMLDRKGLSEGARRAVRALIAQAESGKFLDDGPAEWDIEALDRTGAGEDDHWWLDRGKRAWRAGLYGLAHECYERAARRASIWYDDPPNWAQGALTQADRHLQLIEDALR